MLAHEILVLCDKCDNYMEIIFCRLTCKLLEYRDHDQSVLCCLLGWATWWVLLILGLQLDVSSNKTFLFISQKCFLLSCLMSSYYSPHWFPLLSPSTGRGEEGMACTVIVVRLRNGEKEKSSWEGLGSQFSCQQPGCGICLWNIIL